MVVYEVSFDFFDYSTTHWQWKTIQRQIFSAFPTLDGIEKVFGHLYQDGRMEEFKYLVNKPNFDIAESRLNLERTYELRTTCRNDLDAICIRFEKHLQEPEMAAPSLQQLIDAKLRKKTKDADRAADEMQKLHDEVQKVHAGITLTSNDLVIHLNSDSSNHPWDISISTTDGIRFLLYSPKHDVNEIYERPQLMDQLANLFIKENLVSCEV